MPEWMQWAAGIISTATLGVLGWVANVLVSLPREYVTRKEIDQRIADLEQRVHLDMVAQENRSEKRFDRIEAFLVRIEEKIDRKQDK